MEKVSLATLKAFIRREYKNKNLYIKEQSRFDGSIDSIRFIESGFSQVENFNELEEHTLGIQGLWLVKGSRDYITPWADKEFIGYEISNCCGQSILAFRRLF